MVSCAEGGFCGSTLLLSAKFLFNFFTLVLFVHLLNIRKNAGRATIPICLPYFSVTIVIFLVQTKL
jgi:hypothetical protein